MIQLKILCLQASLNKYKNKNNQQIINKCKISINFRNSKIKTKKDLVQIKGFQEQEIKTLISLYLKIIYLLRNKTFTTNKAKKNINLK